MRAKSLIFILICLTVTTFCLFLFGDQQPTLHSIVSETHKQLNNLKNLKDNLKATQNKELKADPEYLTALGFSENPRLYPFNIWHNVSLPVVATAILTEPVEVILVYLHAIRRFLPDSFIVIYDLGLLSDLESILKYCNTSNCTVKKFDYSLYPAHVADLSIGAYRPVIIQDILDKVGAVFWLDINYQLTTGQLEPTFKKALSVGVAAWSHNRPTSALTHPHMFDYFRTHQQNFYFHHMVDPAHVILYNKPDVHTKLMLPWLQCALTSECVAPIGAQRSGCRFDKKPLYRYSGCHNYDASAFSVALGIMFNYNDATYIVTEEIFEQIEADSSTRSVAGGNNTTEFSSQNVVATGDVD